MKLSVTILVKNAAKTLKETLASCAAFEEVILLDTGSTDSSFAIAREFPNVSIHSAKFLGFGPTHNLATSLASNDWILSIDADEVLSKELIQEMRDAKLEKGSVYSLLRENYFNGKKIEWCGWQKERCVRLYNRTQTKFTDAFVHESVITLGLKIIPLKGALKHTPYATISDFLRKMEHYSTLFAEERMGKKKSSPLIALWHGMGAFFKSYIIKKGFLGGYEGYLISLYNGHTAFYKYLKLYHLNHENLTGKD